MNRTGMDTIDHKRFLKLARIVSNDSSDPYKKVGVVIPIANNQYVFGYNSLVTGLPDTEENWEKNTKQHLVAHAELNAIIQLTIHAAYSATITHSFRLYSTHRPCNDCTKLLIQMGVTEIYYTHDRDDDGRENYTDYMLTSAGVLIYQIPEEEL